MSEFSAHVPRVTYERDQREVVGYGDLGVAVSGWAHSAMTWVLNDSDRNGVLVAWASDLKL